tara:strand:+ start:1202 stop:2104 length:903 start_codon:yes stop_codon:yes gene_type:complete
MYNPYPVETKWFASLSKDNCLHILPYGLMSEKIQPLVQEYRQNIRNKTIQKLMKETHNDRLNYMIKLIKEEYIYINSCENKKIIGGYGSKNKKVEWYKKYKIPLYYLINANKIDKTGAPIINMGTRIMYKNEPYIIIESNNNSRYCSAYKIVYSSVNNVSGFEYRKPDWKKIMVKKYVFLNYYIRYQPEIYKLDPWYIKKILVEKNDPKHKYIKYVTNCNTEHVKREDFWDNFINPALPNETNESICKDYWYDLKYDVWNIVKPPPGERWFQYPLFTSFINRRWNEEWDIIISLVDMYNK